MSATDELPEYQIFSILRHGEEEPIGPYSQNQIVELLNSGDVSATDLVYYPELDGWKPLSEVFELHQNFANFDDHGQDPKLLSDSYAHVNIRSEPEEEIYYVAVQYFPSMKLTASVRLAPTKCIVLTNHRFCVLGHKVLGGIEMNEFPLEQVANVSTRIKEGDKTGVFTILLKSTDRVEVDRIPLVQLERLEHLAGQMLGISSAPE